MPKTHKERRRAAKEAFLGGKARRAHVNKFDVRRSFEEDRSMPSNTTSTGNERPCSSNSELAAPSTPTVCPQCAPILTRYDCSN